MGIAPWFRSIVRIRVRSVLTWLSSALFLAMAQAAVTDLNIQRSAEPLSCLTSPPAMMRTAFGETPVVSVPCALLDLS